LIITTRSEGTPYHGFPYDSWRYEISDIKDIFSDFDIKVLECDQEWPGVFWVARKSEVFIENRLLAHYQLYSMVLHRRCSVASSNVYFYLQTNKKTTLIKYFIYIDRLGYYIKHFHEVPKMIKRKWTNTVKKRRRGNQ
jgi:hypothetical protein